MVYGAASRHKTYIHSEQLVDEGYNLLSFNLAYFIRDRFTDWQTALGGVIGLVASGELKVEVAHQYQLAEAVAAHTAIEARQTIGKVVLIP